MYDPPSGMQAKVERLLQVLAVLRAADLPVRRSNLIARVDDYREQERAARRAAPGKEHDKAVEALHKKVNLDLEHLRGLGFVITDTAGEGLESTWVLTPTPWRLPVELDEAQEAVLSWLLGAGTGSDPALPQPPEVALLGSLPSALDLTHAALAGRRRLVVRRQGQEKTVEPVQLHVRHGHWYLLVRYGPDSAAYGYRLDRLDVVRLGEVMATAPEPVDAQEVLDATAWRKHAPVAVELRCRFEDTVAVASWFPRAAVREHPSATRLTFTSTNLDAVVDRVIGLAGAARIVAPPAAVDLLRTRLTDVLGIAA